MPRADRVRHFSTKAHGVSRWNADGTSRQEIIRRCRPREALALVPDPDNPEDADAIKVCRQNGEQLGTLGADVAEEVSVGLGQGCSYRALLANITGRDKDTLGVNLLVVEAAPWTSQESVDRYIRELDYSDFDKKPLPKAREAQGCSWRTLGCVVLLVLGVLLFVAVRNGLAPQRRPASQPANHAAPTAPAPSHTEPIRSGPADSAPPRAFARPAGPERATADTTQPGGLLKGMTRAEQRPC